jgi:hypothetical protein
MKLYPVVIENSSQSSDSTYRDRFVVGHCPENKLRVLFNICSNAWGWAICYDEMELEKTDEFIVWANDIAEACLYASELPVLIRNATARHTYDCLFSIGFSIQGCPLPNGDRLEASDFRAAIERRMADLDTAGNLEWAEAVQCLESVEEQEGKV